jgi:hypothetical protein
VLARLCVTCESDGGGAEIRICNVRTAASVVLVWTPSERWCWCWGVVIAGKAGWLHALVQPTEAGLATLPNPRGRPCSRVGRAITVRSGLVIVLGAARWVGCLRLNSRHFQAPNNVPRATTVCRAQAMFTAHLNHCFGASRRASFRRDLT